MVVRTLPDPSTKLNGNNHFMSQKQKRSQSGMKIFPILDKFSSVII